MRRNRCNEGTDVQYVETWGYRKKESTGAVGDTRGWLVVCLVLFMQRGGDLSLLANRALVGHRCGRGARQVSPALINRERLVGFADGSLQGLSGEDVCAGTLVSQTNCTRHSGQG